MSNPESLSWCCLVNGKPCRATEESAAIDFEAVELMYAALLKPTAPLAVCLFVLITNI